MWLGWSPSIWLAYKHWLHNECQQQPLGFYSCWLHRMPHPIWQPSWTGTWKWTHQHHLIVGTVSYWHSIHSHQTSNSSPTRFLFMWDSGIWHTHTLLFAKPVSINECAASWWGEDESFLEIGRHHLKHVSHPFHFLMWKLTFLDHNLFAWASVCR